MLLCATSLSAKGATYFVNPGKQGHELTAGQCLTHKKFVASNSLQQLKNLGIDVTRSGFSFMRASSDLARTMLSKGLRLMCPRAFDPKGELVNNECSNN
jgi:hypothetical protein